MPVAAQRIVRSRRMGVLRLVLRGLGQALITAGVVVLLFVAYELWFTGFYTNHEQHVLSKQLAAGCRAPAGPPREGHPVAELQIPRLGPDYRKVVVEGVSHEDLKKGPGHYPGTVLPGQVGNFVVSGHRTTYGAPFNQLDELHPGDRILLDTCGYRYTYVVTRTEIVQPDDVAVIARVPDHPGQTPTAAMLTFTTCNPEYSATQRLVVHGRLAGTQPNTAASLATGG